MKKSKDTYKRTSKHTIKFANKGKQEEYHSVRAEYIRVCQLYVDFLWDNEIHWKGNKTFSRKKRKFDCPSMLSTIWVNEQIKLETFLSSRMLKCCITQACSIIRSVLTKQAKRQHIVNKKRKNGQKVSKTLRKRLRNYSKPDVSNINPEINSLCCNFQDNKVLEYVLCNQTNYHFDFFLQLYSYTKEKNKKLNLPFKHTEVSNKWKCGKRLNSVLLAHDHIEVRYEHEKKIKKEGIVVGGDQGKTEILNLSDKQKTPQVDIHGHSCDSILEKMSRRKKGSKGFKRAKDHLTNFVGWSINQLNFEPIKVLKQEQFTGLKNGKRMSRKMSHWSNPMIIKKVANVTEYEEVLLILQSCTYRSQRCSCCGLVLKSNRHGKDYTCSNCGLIIDADYNASLNHQQELPDVPTWLRKSKLNLTGFFWRSDGFYSMTGEELTVPHTKK